MKRLERYRKSGQTESFGIIPVHKKGDEYLFLVLRQYALDGDPGHWGFPKGHREKGESDTQAAKREFVEETGIKKVEVLEKPVFGEKYVFTFEKRKIFKTVKYFLGFVQNMDVDVQKEEVYDYRWADFKEALELVTFKEGKKILKQANQYLDV